MKFNTFEQKLAKSTKKRYVAKRIVCEFLEENLKKQSDKQLAVYFCNTRGCSTLSVNSLREELLENDIVFKHVKNAMLKKLLTEYSEIEVLKEADTILICDKSKEAYLIEILKNYLEITSYKPKEVLEEDAILPVLNSNLRVGKTLDLISRWAPNYKLVKGFITFPKEVLLAKKGTKVCQSFVDFTKLFNLKLKHQKIKIVGYCSSKIFYNLDFVTMLLKPKVKFSISCFKDKPYLSKELCREYCVKLLYFLKNKS